MPLVRVPDRDTGGWEINALAEIGRVNTKHGSPDQNFTDPRPRWSDSTVWKLAGGRYAVLRGSYSRIYHTEPTTCHNTGRDGPGTGSMSGQSATADDLPDDAIPCPKCQPVEPYDLLTDDKIRYEFPRQTMEICETPAQVIERLTSHRKFSGTRQVTVSDPVKDLLEQLRANDPAFRGRSLPMQRIG